MTWFRIDCDTGSYQIYRLSIYQIAQSTTFERPDALATILLQEFRKHQVQKSMFMVLLMVGKQFVRIPLHTNIVSFTRVYTPRNTRDQRITRTLQSGVLIKNLFGRSHS